LRRSGRQPSARLASPSGSPKTTNPPLYVDVLSLARDDMRARLELEAVAAVFLGCMIHFSPRSAFQRIDLEWVFAYRQFLVCVGLAAG
jgi:hypothetical protein